MYSKFPISMENIPRHRGAGCFSLKFGCIVTALVVLLYTLVALAGGFAELGALGPELKDQLAAEAPVSFAMIVFLIFVHSVSFVLTVAMLIGALRNKAYLIKPWVVWKSLQLVASILMFVFINTMAMINQFADTTLLICALQFFTILIRFYMLVLVSSFYKQLLEDNAETEKLKNLINSEHWYTGA